MGVIDLVLEDTDGPEDDLDGSVGLGTVAREPPITDAFVTELTLSEGVKWKQKLTAIQKIAIIMPKWEVEKKYAKASSNHQLFVLPCPFHFWHVDCQVILSWMKLWNLN